MIDLTVKTLDSQNHAFSLNDDITVRQFKDHIADTVNISADLQRLIYCGRVLQDEKLLSEYDVNGKVIHLVQRAPPSSTQRSHSNNQSQGQGHGGTGEWQSTPRVLYRHTQFHDDPMYIGSFSIPADVLEGYEWPTPQLSNTLATSHLAVVRRMLDQANSVIDRLDNPPAPSSGSTSTENNSSSSSSSSSTQSNQTQSTIATESGNSAWTASASTTEINTPTLKTNDNADVNPTTTPSETNTESSHQQSRDDTTTQHSASNQASSSESNDPAPTNEALVPRELAELLEMLLTTQDRLRPYIRNRLLSNGAAAWPQLTNDENQRVIDGVTECFHFLSHAQHALSNLNINMQQPPPRTLRCRPMVIQPSAILQAGLPIQVEAHISLHGQNENNADSDDNTTNPSRPSQPTTQTTTSSTSNNETSSSIGNHSQSQFTSSSQSTPEPPRQTPQQQSQSQTAFGTVFNFPNNVEVVMESAPQASRVWSFSTGDNQGSSNNNNNNNNVTNNNNGNSTSGPNTGATGIGGGSFPWGGAPSPDIIRNLIQAVTGYMTQTGVAHTSTPATTSSSSPSNPSTNATPMGCPRHRTAGGNESANSGQNSQTRGNTETHPTTSTQTRTTSRTHVFHQHAQALGVGVGLAHSLDFDPFLPCNSHHIRRRNSSSSTSSQSASASAATTNIAASTQTGGQNNTSTGTNAPTQARTPLGTLHPRVATIRGVPIFDHIFDNTSLAESIANYGRISSMENDIPFYRLLSYRGTNLLGDASFRFGGLLRCIFNELVNIPIHMWFRLVRNDASPITDTLIYSLRNLIREYTGETSIERISIIVSELLCNELKSVLETTFYNESAFDNNGREIDIHATVNKMLEKFVQNLAIAIYSEEIVGTNIVQIIQDFGRDLSSVLRYSLNRRQDRLERVIGRFARDITRGTHERFRTWILGTVVEWFYNYTRQAARIDESKILEFLVYKTNMTEVATTSSETAPNRIDAALEFQPMEIDTESISHAPAHNSWMDEDEIIPATFPGEEGLMSDWIPIVARDTVTQRRQLSLSDDDVTTMSDAYLSTMPSKRRKLVEQRKAPLLMNPSSNRSAIPSSMERLIRESVGRAGFEEVDGAVAAIVADPTVRRAFGQAIRESLNPRRYQTPDFPDALRFPNATKFFTNPNRPAKQ